MDTSDLSPLAAPAPPSEALPSRNHKQTASLGERVQSLRLRSGGGGRSSMPRSALLPWGLTVICCLATAAGYYRFYSVSRADPTAEKTSTDKSAAENVSSSSTVPPGEVALESKGYVVAAHTIQISPQVGGEVKWLRQPFYEGLVLTKGDKIAEVDPVSYDARVRSSEALVKVAEVNLQEVEKGGSALKEIQAARSQLESLKRKLEISTIDETNKRRAGVGSTPDDLQKAVSQTLADHAACESQEATLAQLTQKLTERVLVAQAQLRRSNADLDDARKQLHDCTIKAPITGTILTKKAELGGYVNPLAFGNVAGYLCEMADLGDLEIEIDVQERDLPRVFKGQTCIVMPEAYRRDDVFMKSHPRGYEGTVDRLMPTAKRSSAAVPVRVTVKIPEGEAGKYLRPDMSVIVSFLNKK